MSVCTVSKRNVRNLDSEWGERNCNIRTGLIYADSHGRGQISASAMTVLSGEQMAALVRRRKGGDTLLDTLKGWPDGAGFYTLWSRERLIRSVLTGNKPKRLTSRYGYESKENAVPGREALAKHDKETLNTQGSKESARWTHQNICTILNQFLKGKLKTLSSSFLISVSGN